MRSKNLMHHGGRWKAALLAPVVAALFLGTLLAPAHRAWAEDPFITVASTTSTQNSGLFNYLLPIFKKKTGIDVHVVAVGTGAAIKLAEKGDADVLFVHDPPSELKFMAAGGGVDRREVMYNDFIVVGPDADPAGIKGMQDVSAAFKIIAEKKAPFISRGDNSGTYKHEMRYWAAAGIDPRKDAGTWYKEIGKGMGAALNICAASDSYTLSDRGTWLYFKNKQHLVIEVQGDPKLFNQYGIMLVNPKKWPHVKVKEGMEFINFVTSPEGQQVIGEYKINGQQLFHPNYKK